jgi:hypothetical protein
MADGLMDSPIERGARPHALECAYAPTQNGHYCTVVCWRPGEPCPLRVPADRSMETVEAWLAE